MLDIVQIPILEDNYTYLLRCPATGTVGLVDSGDPKPVLEALEQRGWRLDWILNTHHHWDHVTANLPLKQATGCRIAGPDDDRIPGVDQRLSDGEVFHLGQERAEVLFIPGHTRSHIAFHFPDSRALFSGDTIFVAGCGRLFEGTPEQMWSSMARLGRLPGDTRVFGAHEYTLSSLRFARSVLPHDEALEALEGRARGLREQGRPTVPTTLAEERETNPFFGADQPKWAAAIGQPQASPAQVLGTLRARKDVFKG